MQGTEILKAYSSRDTVAAKGRSAGAWHSTNITPFTPFSCGPDMVQEDVDLISMVEAYIRVRLRVRIQRSSKPTAPGALGL